MRTDRDQHGGKAFVEEVIQVGHWRVQAKFDAQVNNVRNLAFDDLGWQAEFRHAQSQHPARHRHRLEDGHRITPADEVLRGGQAARSRPDDRDALIGMCDLNFINRLARIGIDLVRDKSFQRADVNRFVYKITVAGRLATVITNAPADAGEGIIHFDHAQGVIPTSLADQGNVTLRALASRACVAAGSNAALFNGKGIGYGLGIQFVSRAARRESLIELVRHNNRANLGAIAAGDTLVYVNETRRALDGDSEVPGLSVDFERFAVRENLDAGMASGLDQFRRDGAHGAIVGREGFIQLCHVTADGRFLFNQVNFETLLGKVEGSLHTGDPSADNHDRADNRQR